MLFRALREVLEDTGYRSRAQRFSTCVKKWHSAELATKEIQKFFDSL